MHALSDRLTAIGWPIDLNDQLGGWGSEVLGKGCFGPKPECEGGMLAQNRLL